MHCAGPAVDAHTNARDKAARQKLNEIMGWEYPIEKIVEGLLGTSDACEDQCSPEMQAKVWMYAGIAFAAGNNDLQGAQCAFEIALAWDPKVVLDLNIVNDVLKVLFARVRRDKCGN